MSLTIKSLTIKLENDLVQKVKEKLEKQTGVKIKKQASAIRQLCQLFLAEKQMVVEAQTGGPQ